MDSDTKKNNTSGNGSDIESMIKKIKDAAAQERNSYENFFGTLRDSLSFLDFEKENTSIQYNLGMANRQCHIVFEPNNISGMFEKIKNNPEVQEFLPPRETDISGLYIYGLQSNLNHHRSVEQCEWLKQKGSFLSPRLLSKQVMYKFLRPYFNVQQIFNENLLSLLNVLIESVIQERKSLSKLGSDVQAFNSSIIRCLNDWSQKDIKKEHQFATYISNLISTQFQYIRTEIEKIKSEVNNRFKELHDIINIENQGIQNHNQEILKELNRVNDKLKYTQNLKQDFETIVQKESNGVREEIKTFSAKVKNDFDTATDNLSQKINIIEKNVYKSLEEQKNIIDFDLKQKTSFLEELIKHVNTTTENIFNDLKETSIKNLKESQDGVRAEFVNYSNKIKEDIWTAFNHQKSETENTINQRTEHLNNLSKYIFNSTSEISENLKESFVQTLKSESEGLRSEFNSYIDRFNIEMTEIIKKQSAELKVELNKKINEEFSIRTAKLDEYIKSFRDIVISHKSNTPQTGETIKERPKFQVDEDDFDFYAFEEWSRGTEARIKSEQSVYLPYLKGRKHILDLGCGRGEFLEILKENSVPSRGIDMDPRMVLHCVKKGLDVQLDDIFNHLENLQENVVDAFFAAQVVEHLTTSQLKKLAQMTFRKIVRGGIIIFETINPCCLSTFSGALYADPTHQKPVHPVALQFFLEKAGFSDCQMVFSVPIPEESKLELIPAGEEKISENSAAYITNKNFEKLNSILYTFAHYAIIAMKK